jgi:hypothetical protein
LDYQGSRLHEHLPLSFANAKVSLSDLEVDRGLSIEQANVSLSILPGPLCTFAERPLQSLGFCTYRQVILG